jgi:hypothetical protein
MLPGYTQHVTARSLPQSNTHSALQSVSSERPL